MKRTARLIVIALTFGAVLAAMVVGPMPAIGQSAPDRPNGVRQDRSTDSALKPSAPSL
jgi:hypothetical protein